MNEKIYCKECKHYSSYKAMENECEHPSCFTDVDTPKELVKNVRKPMHTYDEKKQIQ